MFIITNYENMGYGNFRDRAFDGDVDKAVEIVNGLNQKAARGLRPWADVELCVADDNEATMGLCRGRHDIPGVTEYVYPNELDPANLGAIHEIARDMLIPKVEAGMRHLNLFVTGLTVALVEVINFCRTHGIALTLWHYDRTLGLYYPQEVE